jgi:RecA-family ATPase
MPLAVSGIVSGEGGASYKSTLLLDLCISRALCGIIKKPWLGKYPFSQGRSLYISLEDDVENVHRRIHVIYAKKTEFEADTAACVAAINKNFLLLTREQFFEGDHSTLITPEGKHTEKYKKLRTTIAVAQPSLVIIDTRSKASSVDENDNEKNTRLMSLMVALCKSRINGSLLNKATILLVSHVSKAVRAGVESNGSNSVRGASSLSDDSRWNLWVRPLGRKDKENRPLIELVPYKTNFGPPLDSFILAVKWPEFIMTDTTKEDIKAADKDKKLNEVKTKIIELLEEGEKTAGEISERIVARKENRLDALDQLTSDEIIKVERVGTQRKYSLIVMVP